MRSAGPLSALPPMIGETAMEAHSIDQCLPIGIDAKSGRTDDRIGRGEEEQFRFRPAPRARPGSRTGAFDAFEADTEAPHQSDGGGQSSPEN